MADERSTFYEVPDDEQPAEKPIIWILILNFRQFSRIIQEDDNTIALEKVISV